MGLGCGGLGSPGSSPIHPSVLLHSTTRRVNTVGVSPPIIPPVNGCQRTHGTCCPSAGMYAHSIELVEIVLLRCRLIRPCSHLFPSSFFSFLLLFFYILYLLPHALSAFGVPGGRSFGQHGSAQPRSPPAAARLNWTIQTTNNKQTPKTLTFLFVTHFPPICARSFGASLSLPLSLSLSRFRP